jgi:hypothetical protein
MQPSITNNHHSFGSSPVSRGAKEFGKESALEQAVESPIPKSIFGNTGLKLKKHTLSEIPELDILKKPEKSKLKRKFESQPNIGISSQTKTVRSKSAAQGVRSTRTKKVSKDELIQTLMHQVETWKDYD